MSKAKRHSQRAGILRLRHLSSVAALAWFCLGYAKWHGVEAKADFSVSNASLVEASASEVKAKQTNRDINLVFDTEDMKPIPGGSGTTLNGNQALVTLEDLAPVGTRLREGFINLKHEVRHVGDLVTGLNELTDAQDEEADRLAKLDNQFKVFHHKALDFQENVQDAFSLLLVQSLHSKAGYCCCFKDLINGDICRWNQAQTRAWYFKKQGCSVLGLTDYAETIRKDVNAGVMATRAVGMCAAFVQSALQMPNSQSDLFEEEAWQNAAPIKQYLDHFGSEKGAIVASQWNEAKALRSASRAKLKDLISKWSCDIGALSLALRDAYKAYLLPGEYTRAINQISDCVEAKNTAEKMITPGNTWDPVNQEEEVNKILTRLGQGGVEEKRLKTALEEEVTKRKEMQTRIDARMTAFTQRTREVQLVNPFNKGKGKGARSVALWIKAVKAGLPPGEVNHLLESELQSASDANLQDAYDLALSKDLKKEVDKIHLEIMERRDVQTLENGLLGITPAPSTDSSLQEEGEEELEILPEDYEDLSEASQDTSLGKSSLETKLGNTSHAGLLSGISSFLQTERRDVGVSPHRSSSSSGPTSFLQAKAPAVVSEVQALQLEAAKQMDEADLQ